MTIDFQPINKDHAIELVSFRILLSRIVTVDDLQACLDRHGSVRAELPAVATPPSDTPTIQFAYLRPNGSALWDVRIGGGNEIRVTCRRYTRWAKIWHQAQEMLHFALSSLASVQEVEFGAVELRVVDRFRAVVEDFNIGTLINSVPEVAPALFELGPIAHSNVGWFENSDAGRVLNVLNVQGRNDTLIDGSGSVSENFHLVIDHRQEITDGDVWSSEDFRGLSHAAEFLHRRNKGILERLLVEEAREMIGLRKQ